MRGVVAYHRTDNNISQFANGVNTAKSIIDPSPLWVRHLLWIKQSALSTVFWRMVSVDVPPEEFDGLLGCCIRVGKREHLG